MVYFIIIVALLVIAAPILAILPTQRDKARMAKRKRVMGLGIGVEMTTIEDPDPDLKKYRSSTGKPLPRRLSLTAYRLRRRLAPDQTAEQFPGWTIVRFNARGRAPLLGDWYWEADAPGNELNRVLGFLTANLAQLPLDVIKIEEKNQFISLYWHEDGEVQEVIDFLERCAVL
tara:strand:- start:4094 stop:4612 length:519 start_codon:yes stop_codon:yes gene_type:complete